MKWADIVDDEWVIATSPREKGNPGRLRLPKAAFDILASLPRVHDNEFVFPGHGSSPFSRWSEMKHDLDGRLKQEGFQIERWTIHDLRRTARSLMSRAGVLPHVAEQVLGHAQPGIIAVYDRHRYDAEKAEALNRLSALIHGVVFPQDNVVQIRA
jgi:integrase